MKKFRKMITIIVTTAISFSYTANAQVAINADGTAPNASAMLDVKSSNKGFLPPRMNTTQMNAITTPAAGLMIFNTAVNSIFYYDGSTWRKMYTNMLRF